MHAAPAMAQTTSLLQIHTIEVAPGAPPEFIFADQGTGATNYTVQFAPTLESPWSIVAGAAVTSLGGGNYRVVAPDAQTARGFYRVRGNGGAVIASFVTTAFRVIEGETVTPTVTFNAPFFGTIRYTVSGTAGSGDFTPLSGEVLVNGTTAVIPVTLADNLSIGELKFLSLRLEAGPGYRLGTTSQSTVTIDENDAEWQGSFVSRKTALGFVLPIRHSAEGHDAALKSEEFGFFPTNEFPAQITFTPDAFSVLAAGIPIPPEATLLNSRMVLTFQLNANNGVINQLVTPDRVEGMANLVIQVPDKPYLNATNEGTFLLVKPPVRPSTNQVQLGRIP